MLDRPKPKKGSPAGAPSKSKIDRNTPSYEDDDDDNEKEDDDDNDDDEVHDEL